MSRQAHRAGIVLALCLCVSLAYANTEPAVTEPKPATPPVPAPEPAAAPATDTTEATEAAETPTSPAAEPGTGAGAPEAGAAPTTVEATTPPAPAASPGMQIPVDGTSLEAFNASLAAIQQQSTAAEYITLTNAIDYLLVYNLSAHRDRTKLAALLDGKTGVEIVDMVTWQNASKKKSDTPQEQTPPEQTATEPATLDGS